MAGLLALPLLPGCQQGSDLVICEDGSTPTPTPPDAPVYSIAELQTQLGAPVQTFSYDPTRQNQFAGAKGTVVTIPANAFIRANGVPITTPFKMELREIFGKADMVLSNMPTVSNGRLLESAGEVYLRPAQNQRLDSIRLVPGAVIQLRTQNPPNVASLDSMRLFVAPPTGPSSPSCFNWQINFDPASSLQPTSTGYVVNVSSVLYDAGYGWFNCDRFYDIADPQPILVDVPGTGVDPVKNTMVFAVFKNMNGTLRICDFTAPGTFEAKRAPGGTAISVIVIQTLNGKLYYGRQDGTIAAGFRFSPALSEITKADLQTVLATL
ncbi:hypothetical protein [Hymenobacter tenuis]